MNIHVTERQTYKQCRRKWDYRYRRNLVPTDPPRDARWVGTAVHLGMSTYYNQEDPLEALRTYFDNAIEPEVWFSMSLEDQETYEQQRTLVMAMMTNYMDYAASDDIRPILVEAPLRCRIPGTRGWLIGTIDLLVRRNGKLWVWDHKTCTSFTDSGHLEMDDQMTSYLWLVWRTFGEKPVGAVYNELRKKIPAKPYLLKSGKSLSVAKNIDTTADIYRQAIQEHGFDEADYAEILESLELNEFVRRTPIARNPHELESYEHWLREEYREMRKPSTPLYPTLGRSCRGCDYRIICRATNEGADAESLEQALYTQSDSRRDTYEDS